MLELKELLLASIREHPKLSEEERGNLLGECDLIQSFLMYNDISRMSQFHRSASEKMTRPAISIRSDGGWTFGSPSVLMMFHRKSGDLDKELEEMNQCMPHYYKITNGHGQGAETIMSAEAHFMRGNFVDAHIALEKAYTQIPRSAGKTYEEAVGGRWKMDTPMPEAVKKLVVMNVNEVEKVASTVDFVFSAVDMSKEEIKAIEEEYAKTETPVVSNNSAHRWTPDVPMVVPEINPEHFEVIESQKKRLGTTRGFIAVKPNCSIQSYAPVLTAWKEFEPYEVVATTYQAISGAGKTFKDWPEMVENIIPYIGGEEEKSEQEPLRIWGKVENGQIVKASEPVITCQCIRVPVLNGHTAAVFVKFRKNPTKEQLIEKLVNFKGFPCSFHCHR